VLWILGKVAFVVTKVPSPFFASCTQVGKSNHFSSFRSGRVITEINIYTLASYA
jgi:hypothetical protein